MSWAGARVSRVGEMESHVLELGEMVCARHVIPAGFDSAPYYRGLPDDMCPCEHWCYLVRGRLRYRFADGEVRELAAGDAFHVRAGHLTDVLEDAELIEFTRAEDYRRKAEHLERRTGAARAEQILTAAYAAFNAGDLDSAIELMHPDVDWPNAWEGGRVWGRAAVREYWERQLGAISSQVEPERFSEETDGSITADVRQVVRDARTGELVADSRVRHRYRFEDELIVRMDALDS